LLLQILPLNLYRQVRYIDNPRRRRETLTTRDKQTAGFSVHGVVRRQGTNRQTDGQTDARPLYTRYQKQATAINKTLYKCPVLKINYVFYNRAEY